MFQFILGSQSQRRKEILEFFNLPFKQAVSYFNEEAVPFDGDPEEYVRVLSLGKARALHPLYPEAIILTADTIVYREGVVYGKPQDRADAFRILSALSGHWHAVYTGMSLLYGEQIFHRVEKTDVLFNPLSPREIDFYLDSFSWSDKSGSYGIQAGGGLAVNKIHGCYYNVMGLPTNALKDLLSHVGIDLWKHVKS